MASDVVAEKLGAAHDALAAARKNARMEFGLWVTARGRDYVMLPERTPFNDWRAVNKASPLVLADLLGGGKVRRNKKTLELAPAVAGGAFVSADEYATVLDIIEWAFGDQRPD